jgi:hypothetical protein
VHRSRLASAPSLSYHAVVAVRAIGRDGSRALLIAGVAACYAAGAACHLDETGKGHCLIGADCNPGKACVAELCVPIEAGATAWSVPLVYVAGLRREACDPTHASYVAAEALRRSGFAPVPFVSASGAFYAAGVNENTRAMLSVTVGMNARDFWFDVITSTQADGASARRWRDQILEALRGLTLPCGAEPGPIAPDGSVLGIGPPPLWYATRWLATPTACGGFAFCGRAARAVMIERGLAPRPESDTASLLAAASGDVSMVIQCADFGTFAVLNVVTASMRYAADPAWQTADAVASAPCP